MKREIAFISFAQWRRQSDKEMLRHEFRGRQFCLASSAAVQIFGAIFTGYAVFFALAALLIQAGAAEALRFRKSGRIHQTKRSIWRGSTPHDARQRHLLNGWRPMPS